MIKLGNNDITLKVGSADVGAVYLGSTLVYSGGTPPTPSFDGKWLATYSDSHTESAQCDASSAITAYAINKDNIRNLLIGECVTGITSTYIFYHCSLTSVTIGNNVSFIAGNSFGACYDLKNVIIGSGITSIGNSAFNDCSGLTSIMIEATTPPTLGTAVFSSTNNCPIFVPAASVSAYKSAWSSLSSRIQAIP